MVVETVDPALIVAVLRLHLAPVSVFIHREEEHFLYVNNPPSLAAIESCARFGLVYIEPNALDWTDNACVAWVAWIENAAVCGGLDPECRFDCRLDLSMTDLLFLRDCRRLKSYGIPPDDYSPLKRILKLLAMPDGMRRESLPAAIMRLRQDCAVAMRLNNTRTVKAAAFLLGCQAVWIA